MLNAALPANTPINHVLSHRVYQTLDQGKTGYDVEEAINSPAP